MMKIEALIQPFKLEEVKATLEDLGIEGVTIFEVLDHGGPNVCRGMYRGAEYRLGVRKVKLEMIVSSLHVDEVVEAVVRAARTTMPGDDGTVLVYELTDAVRIRNGSPVERARF